MPPRYTDAERTAALAALAASGGDVERASLQIGVPAATLQRWSRDAATERCRGEAVDADPPAPLDECLERVARRLAAVIESKLEAATLQHVAQSLGIVIDRMRLLRGKAAPAQTEARVIVYLPDNCRDEDP